MVREGVTSIMKDNNMYCDSYITNERKHRVKKEWDIANTTTIIDWINNANLYVFMLDTYLKSLRRLLRLNTLWSLVISSITSTISVTQFTINDSEYPEMSFAIKGVIFITSLMTSLITGYIKVEKIQEKIETIDASREKWMKFMTSLTNELQVSSKLRTNAEDIITKNRVVFNELTFKRIEIPQQIQDIVTQFVTSRIKTRIENKKTEQSCFRRSGLCGWSSCMRPNELKQYLELTQQQLSNYTMTHKLLKNELLLLGKAYNNIISDITFKTDTDLFEYTLVTRSVQLVENQRNGETRYSPMSSDNEGDNVTMMQHEDDETNEPLHNHNIIVVTRNDSHIGENTLHENNNEGNNESATNNQDTTNNDNNV